MIIVIKELISLCILLIIFISMLSFKQYMEIQQLRKDIDIIKSKKYVSWKIAKERASYIDWQIQELGMLCGDAINIANTSYDMAASTSKSNYTEEEIDSIITISKRKSQKLINSLK